MSLLAERAEFMLRFLEEPAKIGSITPSSLFLTRKMLAGLPWERMETIVELGAGTGVFTKYMVEHKPEFCQALIIEQNYEMREKLRRRYPGFYYGAKAEDVSVLLQYFALPKADCVISGLPFAAFSRAQQHQVLLAVSQSLQPDGRFVAFQYSLQLKSVLKKYFREVKVAFMPLNFPPAFIYYCKK
ncbi:methyltransferase domain-containing protein [uncultured Anaeromusa sp.]|uniref:class I SAM-dependent methyltransferase n=1 Tax=uncultured Anaeromusa sp. TaxID=673273 RepID=UPI0029C6E7F6|nr:methyltransferase domain-containing protein [uncultured Anaeromusa sp.]